MTRIPGSLHPLITMLATTRLDVTSKLLYIFHPSVRKHPRSNKIEEKVIGCLNPTRRCTFVRERSVGLGGSNDER